MKRFQIFHFSSVCLGKKGLSWYDCFSSAKLGKEEGKNGENGERDQVAMLKTGSVEMAQTMK